MHGRPCIRFGSTVILARSSDMLSPISSYQTDAICVTLLLATLLCGTLQRFDNGLWTIGLAVHNRASFALPRNPHKSTSDATRMASPIKTKPAVTSVSCHSAARCPAAVIGDNAAVPNTAAVVVTAQLP